MEYLSPHGNSLIYAGEPPKEAGIATVENYIKWYGVYIVLPSGEVVVFDAPDGAELWDHCVTPHTARAVRDAGYTWDEVSLDTAAGRYWREIESDTQFDPL